MTDVPASDGLPPSRNHLGWHLAGLAPALVGIGAVVAAITTHPDLGNQTIALAVGGGTLAALAVILYSHPFRVAGFVPPALTLAVAALGWAWSAGWSPLGLAVFWLGLGAFPAFGDPTRGTDAGWRGRRVYTGMVMLVFFALVLAYVRRSPDGPDDPTRTVLFAAGTASLGAAAAISWYVHFRPFVELASVPVLWLMFRVRGAGPGLNALPARGPCLVIGNHACWADPFLIAKVLPRPITPVMTSAFYDLPFISWMMRRVIKAIRVPEKALKQDIPQEIHEVIAALDRGECVVLFPEGYLRRSDDRPLRRFGRGVWQVLSARPDTPVFPCWIEGGWGSYTSYRNGLPTKNKRPDFRRPIGVAVDGPLNVAPDVLAGHLVTRVDLMNRVAAARKWLGLPDLPAYTLAGREDGKDGNADDAERSAEERGSKQD